MSHKFMRLKNSIYQFPTTKLFAISILVCLFYLTILPFNEHIAFKMPYESHQATLVALCLKILFLPFLFGILYFIITFIQKIIQKDPFYILWLKISLAYGLLMLFILIILYPGHWVGDEFDILEAVRNYSLYSWQNYFTNIFYTFSLYLIPTGVGIVAIQLSIISLIIGYVTALSKNIFHNKRTYLILIVPFLAFPVLLNNFYPLRLTLFSYGLLLLVSFLLFLHLKVLSPVRPKLFFIFVAFIMSIICFWRSEGVLYLLTLPLFAYKLGLVQKSKLKDISTYTTILIGLSLIGLAFSINKVTTSDKYQITATLNPISTMIQGDLRGKNINQDLEALDKVVDLSIVKQYPSYDEIPSFWHGAVRDDYYLHLKGYNSHVYSIFANNLNSFLSNRMQTFLRTNSFGPAPALGLGQFYNPDPIIIEKVNHFYATNKLSRPLNPELKLAITKRLLLVNNSYKPTLPAKLIWSVIPTLSGLIILLIISGLKRKWIIFTITIFLLTHAVIIFLTAPASYFMYYLPIYLAGNFLIAFILLKKFEVKIASALLWLRSYLQRNLKKHRKYVFLTVGLVNTLLDFAFYTMLAHFMFNSPEQIGILGIISGTFALLCAYASHRLITWRDKKTTKTTILKFFVVTGFGLWVIRPMLLSWFITFTPLYNLFSHAANHIGLPFSYDFIASTGAFFMMVIIVMVYNYITYGRFVFTDKR